MEERSEKDWIEKILDSMEEYTGPSRVEWKRRVIPLVKRIVQQLQRQGKKIKLRTLFYQLVSMKVIPALQDRYNTLSRRVNEAKMQGIIPFGVIVDEERKLTGTVMDALTEISEFEERYFNMFDRVTDKKIEEIKQKDIIRFIKNSVKEFIGSLGYMSSVTVPALDIKVEPLAFAETLPVIWTEKSGVAEEIIKWVEEEFRKIIIPIVIGRGYDSGEIVHEFFQKIVLEYKDFYREIVIYHVSDLDPTGTDIPRALREKIKHFCKMFDVDESKIKVEKLALTPEQVSNYRLPPLLKKKRKKEEEEGEEEEYEGNPEVIEKIKRDPRFKRFEEQGYKIVCEVDAFLALRPRDFRNLVIETIKKHIDWDCYKQWKQRYKAIEDALIREQREMQLQARKEKIDDISKQLERLRDEIDRMIEEGKEELKKVKQELEELENKMYMHK